MEETERRPLSRRILLCFSGGRGESNQGSCGKCWKACLKCLKPKQEPMQQEDEEPPRETWKNRYTFFISTLGMSVGLGQVWRFPTLAYKMGGGAFLLMYGLMIALVGNALFFFEVSNGQYSSKNPLRVYDKVPLMQGVGISMIFYSFLFCTYYNHMVSYSVYYFISCMTRTLPWTYCPDETADQFQDSVACFPYSKYRDPDIDLIVCGEIEYQYNRTRLCNDEDYAKDQMVKCCESVKTDCVKHFNLKDICREREYPSSYYWTHTVNKQYRKGDPNYGYIGEINVYLLGTFFLSWLLNYISLYKGLKSMGIVMYVMVPLPYIVLIVMFAVAVTQEGADFGLKKFFMPNPWSFVDINIWRVAAEQAFYSIGIAMGPLVTFGSYTKFSHPSHIDGNLICLCIFLTSVLCSLVVFSVLGFLAKKTGRPFDKVVEAGPGLVFIVYPESLELLPGNVFISALFYFMLIMLGSSSVSAIIETVSSAVYDIWPRSRSYKYLVNLVILLSCFLIGIPITARGGLNIYDAFDMFSAGIPLLPIGALELITVAYVYGLDRFCEDVTFMIGFYPNRYYRYIWMTAPWMLLAILIYGSVVMEIPDWKPWTFAVGGLLLFAVMGWIPVVMIYKLIVYGKEKRLNEVIKAPQNHGPKSEQLKNQRNDFTLTSRRIF